MEDWSRCDRANVLLPALLYILVEVEAASPYDLSEIWIDITPQRVEGCELAVKFPGMWVMVTVFVPTELTNERE